MRDAVPSTSSPPTADPDRIRADLVVIALSVLAAALLFGSLDVSESLFTLTRRWETLQLDEVPATLVVLTTCLAWFSWRRYREARSELVRRRAAEARLAALLMENRHLAQSYLARLESERKYLARELHDELSQYLNAIKTDAVSIQKIVESPPALSRATAIDRHADHLYAIVRNLIRELRPVALDELGLKAALEHYLDQAQQRMPQVSFDVLLEGDLDSLGEPISLAIYRLMQEGVTNVSRHADAKHVAIRVTRAPCNSEHDEVTLSISDDGCGADTETIAAGFGLMGMRERVEMLAGQWRITSGRANGFGIVATIPLTDPAQVTASS